MLWEAVGAARDLGRLREITSVLIRYGFGDLIRRLGLAEALGRVGGIPHLHEAAELARLDAPVRVRRALEELGPTFVKLGQLLATRMDLLDPEWIAEFGKLQDQAPPADYAEIKRQLTEDLGGAPEEVFAAFDPTPIAAASIAQVHRARLREGGEVAVKVRRPGIRPVIEADLRWLARIAELGGAEIPELNRYRPAEFIRQFAQSLRRELDFAVECRNAERIRENFIGFADPISPKPSLADLLEAPNAREIVIIPRVYWRWTGERVCVQQYIEGIRGGDLDAVDKAGLDRKTLARRGTRAVLKMIIEDGFFHADPHPGNVFYLPGERIAFVDFGMVGRLGEGRREQLTRLLFGLTRGDGERVTEVLLDWSDDNVEDEADLTQDVQAFVDQYHSAALKDLRLGAAILDFLALLRAHQLLLPADLAVLFKAFISLEGMGRALDPEFSLANDMTPMIGKIMRAHYLPDAMLARGSKTVRDLMVLASSLPRDLTRQLRAAQRGKLTVHIEIANLQRVAKQIDGAANRIAISIVVAALIAGSSIVMTASRNSAPIGPSLLGVLGLFGAVIGGLWLMVSIWKSGKSGRR